jgi:hypothetical protein
MTTRETVICRHQERFISKNIAEAKALGRFLGITEARRDDSDIDTIASIDATPEQSDQWERQFIRMLFWSEGTRCAKCGHVASGPLTEISAKDKARWRREQEEQEAQEALAAVSQTRGQR